MNTVFPAVIESKLSGVNEGTVDACAAATRVATIDSESFILIFVLKLECSLYYDESCSIFVSQSRIQKIVFCATIM